MPTVEERTREEPLVIKEFSGYYRALEGKHIRGPVGSVTDASKNFIVTNDRKLKKAFGYSQISSSSANVLRHPYWWERSRGGGVALAEAGGNISVLTPGPPQGLWASLSGDAAVTQDDQRTRIGSFSTYGDYLFFANGLDKIKKIRRHDLKVYELGLEPPTSTDLPLTVAVFGKLALAASGLEMGVYQYKFTFVYANGGESNLSDVTFRISVPANLHLDNPTDSGFYFYQDENLDPEASVRAKAFRAYVTLSGFPDSTDYLSLRDDITHINIYRTLKNGSQFFRVGKVLRTQSVFLDSVPDVFLGEPGPLDHDLPPVARMAEVHDNRLWTVGDSAEGLGDIPKYSLVGFPDIFPPFYRIDQAEWVNVGRGTGIRSLSGTLYFFYERGVFRLEGTRPEDYQVTPIVSSFGCVAPNTLRIYRDAFVFLSQVGFVFLQGNSWDVLETSMPFELIEEHWQDIFWSSACIYKDSYIVSLPSAEPQPASVDASMLYRNYVINLKNGFVGLGQKAFDLAADSGPDGYPLVTRFDESGGQEAMYMLGSGFNPLSDSDPYMVLEFHSVDMDHPEMYKTIDKIEVDLVTHSLSGMVLTVTSEDGTTETVTSVSTIDFPIWDTDLWGASFSYLEARPLVLEFYPKRMYGRRFTIKLEETAISGSTTFTRDILLDTLKVFYNFRKRR